MKKQEGDESEKLSADAFWRKTKTNHFKFKISFPFEWEEKVFNFLAEGK